MYRRILVPTDGSEGASRAIDYAVELARFADAELHVINAVDPTLVPVEIGVDAVIESLEARGEDLVDAARSRADSAGIQSVSTVILGSPAEAINDYAADHDIDLIVMGTHGRTGLNRLLLGSVTERVVRTANVPVLTIAPEDHE